MTGRERFARNSIARIAGYVSAKLFLFLWMVTLARLLGPGTFGLYAYIAAWVGIFLIISDYGLGNLITRSVAQRPHQAGPYFWHGLALRGLLAVAAYIFLLAVALLTERSLLTIGAFGLFGLTIFTTSAINNANALWNAWEKMHWTALATFLVPTITLGVGYPLLKLGGGLIGAIGASVGAGLLTVGVQGFLLRREGLAGQGLPGQGLPGVEGSRWEEGLPGRVEDPYGVRLPHRRPLEKTFLWALFKQGFPFFTLSILTTLYVLVDSVLLKFLAGAEAVGFYNVAYKLILVLMIVPMGIAEAGFPIWSREAAQRDNAPILPLDRVLKLLSLVALPVAVGLTFLARPLVVGLFGHEFEASKGALRILAWTLVLMYWNAPLGYILVARGHMRAIISTVAVALTINIGLNLWLIPRMGFQGAALAALASEVVNFALLVYWAYRLGHRFNWISISLRPLLAAGLMALGIALMIRWPLAVWVSLSVVLYAIGLFLVRALEVDDKRLILEFLRWR